MEITKNKLKSHKRSSSYRQNEIVQQLQKIGVRTEIVEHNLHTLTQADNQSLRYEDCFHLLRHMYVSRSVLTICENQCVKCVFTNLN